MRGSRYLTLDDMKRQVDLGLITVLGEQRERQWNLKSVTVESVRYVESDSKLVERVLAREVGGKGNILLMNDEAHHAYRIRHAEPDDGEEDLFGESNQSEEFFREATVWIEGLDRIHKLRGINLCVDLSATPYYLGRIGQDANRPFPWVVSDFGLVDAIESELVKIPQLAVRDTSGATIPGYFNIWRWILPQLTAAERGGPAPTCWPPSPARSPTTRHAASTSATSAAARSRSAPSPRPAAAARAPAASGGRSLSASATSRDRGQLALSLWAALGRQSRCPTRSP